MYDLCNAFSLRDFNVCMSGIFVSYTAHVGCCDRCICLDIIVCCLFVIMFHLAHMPSHKTFLVADKSDLTLAMLRNFNSSALFILPRNGTKAAISPCLVLSCQRMPARHVRPADWLCIVDFRRILRNKHNLCFGSYLLCTLHN